MAGSYHHSASAACTGGPPGTEDGQRPAVADYRTRAQRVFDSPHQGVGDAGNEEDYRTRAERVFDSPDEALIARLMIRQPAGRASAR